MLDFSLRTSKKERLIVRKALFCLMLASLLTPATFEHVSSELLEFQPRKCHANVCDS